MPVDTFIFVALREHPSVLAIFGYTRSVWLKYQRQNKVEIRIELLLGIIRVL